MAIKLADNIKTLPASLYDGKLCLSIGKHKWEIPVAVKQVYNMQVNEHNNVDVFCFLHNNETKLVIRRDGSASVIKKEGDILIKNFFVEIPKELLNGVVSSGGVVTETEKKTSTLAYTYILRDRRVGILSLVNSSVCMVFDVNECVEYVHDLSIQMGPTFPPLELTEGIAYRYKEVETKEQLKVLSGRQVLYKVVGTIIPHSSPMLLD